MDKTTSQTFRNDDPAGPDSGPAGLVVAPRSIPRFREALLQGHFPDRPVTVMGSLDLSRTVLPHGLPPALTVDGDLTLQGGRLPMVPAGLTVTGTLNLANAKVVAVAPDLDVGKDMILAGNTDLSTLPPGPRVGGGVDIRGTGIKAIPRKFRVGGRVTCDDPGTLSGKPRGGLTGRGDRILGSWFAARDIRKGFSWIRSLWQSSWAPEQLRHETFQDACSRLNIGPDEARRRGDNMALVAWFLLTIGIGFLIYGIRSMIVADGFMATTTASGPLWFTPLFLVLAFRFSFRSWQARHQRLGGLGEFLASPRLWLPRL